MLESIRNHSQSLVVKIAFGFIIVVFVFWGIGSFQNAPGVVAKVNGLSITEQDYLAAYNQQMQRMKSIYPQITDEELKQMQFPYTVLQGLVYQTLLVNEAEKIGLEINPRDIYEVISTFPFALDTNGKFSMDLYIETLQANGQNVADFEKGLTEDLFEGKFRELFAASVAVQELQAKNMFSWQAEQYTFDSLFFPDETFMEEVTVSEDEIKAEYEKNITHYALPAMYQVNLLEVTPSTIAATMEISDAEVATEYTANTAKYAVAEQVDASHILLPLAEDAPQAEVDKVLAEIKALEQRIKDGEDFGTLAKEFSADTYSAQSNGSLGFFSKGQMVLPFEEVAFAFEIGQMSEPVRTRFGYHLIKVNDHTQAHTPALEDIKEDIRTELALAKAFPAMQSTLDTFLLAGTEGKSLKETAEKIGFKNVVEAAPLSLEALSFQYQIDDVTPIENATTGKIFSLSMASNQGIYIAELINKQEPTNKSIDDVKEDIILTVQKEKAHALAYAKALEVNSLLEYDTYETTDHNFFENMKISRSGIMSDLGDNLVLAETLFAKEEQPTWLPEAYAVTDGYILVHPKGKEAFDETLWATAKDNMTQQITSARQEMIFSVFIQELTKDANIEILNQAYFQ